MIFSIVRQLIVKTMSQKSPFLQLLQESSTLRQKANRQLHHGIEDIVRSISQRHILSQVINQKEIRVVGLRRSGNHAIIHWIEKQETGKVRHLNNIRVNRNPYREKYEDLLRKDKTKDIEWWRQEAKGFFEKKDCLIHSYEDYSLEQITNPVFELKHDLYFGKSQDKYDVLILRDPFNLLASRIKKNYRNVNDKNKIDIDVWIDYAKEYLGETNLLKNQKICINYNQWFADVDYRREIASQLNLDFLDTGINTVSRRGDGSSFEGREYHGKAMNMDVCSRWKYFADDPSYRRLFNNQELLEYSQRIFGHIPGTECLRES